MNQIKYPYLYILVSAFLYAVPALFNRWFWWVSFVFLLPLFYLVYHKKLSYMQAYVWGLCAVAFHLIGVSFGIMHLAEGSWAQAAIPPLFIVVYAAFFGLLLVFFTQLIQYCTKLESPAAVVCMYSISLWSYFTIMDHFCLFPFGCVEGYFLMHPVLPLTALPKLLRLLPWLKTEGLCLVLVGTQLALFFFLMRRTVKMFFIFAIAAFFWIGCVLVPVTPLKLPSWFARTVVVPYIFIKQNKSVEDMVEQAAAFFADVTKRFPVADILLMPEGSFYCHEFADFPVYELFDQYHIRRPVHILTGSFAFEGKEYRNTLYWFYDGQLKAKFHKKHAMVLTERMPGWFTCDLLKELYFKSFSEISPSYNERTELIVNDQFRVVPYICSELFFAKKPRDCHGRCTILAVCNDRWTLEYVKLLMLRVAQYKAIEWQREVVYVSFKYQRYVDEYGNMHRLTTYWQ